MITKRGFAKDAAARFTGSFRATISLAGSLAQSYNNEGGTKGDESMEILQEIPLNQRYTPAPVQPATLKGPGGLWLKVPFRGYEMTIKIDIEGQNLTKSHIERVIKYLELAKDDLDDGSDISSESQ